MKRARRNKTVAQQCRYYEVENIFDYMYSVYINGNITPFKAMYQELDHDSKRLFVRYIFEDIDPRYTQEIVLATI